MNLFSELYFVLNKNRRMELLLLQCIVVFSAILEVLSISLVGPFLGIVTDPQLLEKNYILQKIYFFLSATTYQEFIFRFGIVIVIFIALSSFISIFTIKKLSYFAAAIGADVGNLLYTFYIGRSYSEHLKYSEAHLSKQIAVEVARVTDNLFQPLVQINARLVVVIAISLGIFLYEPGVALLALSIIFLGYAFIFIYVKNKLKNNGITISESSKYRFHLLGIAFGAFKDIKILKVENFFIEKFQNNSNKFAQAYGSSNTLYNIPKYIMEFVVFTSLVSSIILLIVFADRNVSEVIPSLAILGVAALKILPSFQQIYAGVAQIRSNIAAFYSIYPDIKLAKENSRNSLSSLSSAQKADSLDFNKHIDVENLSLRYAGESNFILKNVEIKINKNEKIAIVGESGSGKSTLLDILMGLKSPTLGKVLVDGKDISANFNEWSKKIGLVSQNIFIINGTIQENIALGISVVDEESLNRSINLASLDKWINSLPEKTNTRIGDGGIQISGGQRQRIGIARALYHNPCVLFLDEATSALDPATEKEVIDSLQEIAKDKTIIMITHRLNTVSGYDRILHISNGEIVYFDNNIKYE